MDDRFVVSKLRGEDGTTVVTVRLPYKLIQRLEDVVIKAELR